MDSGERQPRGRAGEWMNEGQPLENCGLSAEASRGGRGGGEMDGEVLSPTVSNGSRLAVVLCRPAVGMAREPFTAG